MEPTVLDRLLVQLPAGFGQRDDLATAGRPWQIRMAEYDTLLAESAATTSSRPVVSAR